MGLMDLVGKRTGRPRGSKTKSRVKRDMQWAYCNMGKPNAEPPTAGAKMWLDLARSDQGRFLDYVVRLETVVETKHEGKVEQLLATWNPDEAGNTQILNQGPPARVVKMFVPNEHALKYLRGEPVPPIDNFTSSTRIVGCQMQNHGKGIILILTSWS
ncbi:MAG TPA: hypothetical protein VGZ47_13770, partial [Gemmataceae bacterium]|nr:hypothetical protein [Gemmataceae bacterium]